ncbi:hypothetical protein NQZ68_035222 [Dissostichus eleginoides]|nr:hypothetical protein NQZ68_035222 [Dissostichus eleginoides]
MEKRSTGDSDFQCGLLAEKEMHYAARVVERNVLSEERVAVTNVPTDTYHWAVMATKAALFDVCSSKHRQYSPDHKKSPRNTTYLFLCSPNLSSSLGPYMKSPPDLPINGPVAPTLPSLRSEVFKPCVEDKDLAFCLNEGECSIIETVAGVHRHCRLMKHEENVVQMHLNYTKDTDALPTVDATDSLYITKI